ncbi:hypothetical protein [Tepidibacter mesophilus]|uniref:hypothetical protein n=1 Tax=Tepidibacter mesophilus TaxID=655607 RepID=UPI000C08B84A|nr:hypothetical protein [Tepidibacter mesophilus]
MDKYDEISERIKVEEQLEKDFPARSYTDNKEYLEKIKAFLIKRYNANSVDFRIKDEDSWYFANADSKEVNYFIDFNAYVRITKNYGDIQRQDTIQVIIKYEYTYFFKSEKVYENFTTYQGIDSVYIQSPENGYSEYLGLEKVRDF